MNQKKIIGIVASPRVDGNTQKLVELILDSGVENGAETKIFNLNEMDIKGCQSCYHCKTTDEDCAVKDDILQLFEEIKHSDAVIIGTPIYFGQMSAQLKIFIDRHFSQIGSDFKSKLGRKDLVLVFTQGNPNIDQFKQYIEYTSNLFNRLSYKLKDLIIAPGVRRRGAIYKETLLVQKAKEIGEKLAK
ncbi:MAG: flavodoxin family protein [Candidatus Lokiarchaeota archaeon]|nr:flavodoxin family protein [Candidatus Lokiarchaeota archaeon]